MYAARPGSVHVHDLTPPHSPPSLKGRGSVASGAEWRWRQRAYNSVRAARVQACEERDAARGYEGEFRMVQTRDEVQEFLDELTRELQAPARNQATHPVVEDIVAGRLDREQVKRWMAQQYLFSRTVPRLVCLRYGQVTDPEVQAHLMEVIAEEMEGRQTGTDGHVRLHVRAALALGLTVEELEATPPNPETRALVYWQELVVRSRPWFIALGMKYGDEGQ